jgi:hypothetical protein
MSDFEEGDDQEFTNSHTVTMTNGKFFTIRFEKDEARTLLMYFKSLMKTTRYTLCLWLKNIWSR